VSFKFLNEEALPNGFVPVRKLAQRLNAEVVFRPLLVEAMIAANQAPAVGEYDWKVLLDIDRFESDSRIFENENDKSHMSFRSRNTIAHELLHTFAFKKEAGKFLPRLFEWEKQGGAKTVNFLEKEAEKLSSMLLIPQDSLLKFLAPERNQIEIDHLVPEYQKYGVSRQIFINRLRHLATEDNERVLNRPCLKNILVGMGEWTSPTSYSLKTWPVFLNFKNNFRPAFLLEAQSNRSDSIIVSASLESSFYLCGGQHGEVTFEGYMGTEKFPETARCEFRLSVEKVERRQYKKFLFMIHQLDTPVSAANTDQVDFDDLLKLMDN
jgi:hypothetical protein